MKTTFIGMAGVLILAVGLSAQKVPSLSVQNGGIFSGVITDSFVRPRTPHRHNQK